MLSVSSDSGRWEGRGSNYAERAENAKGETIMVLFKS
jgi:hypothetical protein